MILRICYRFVASNQGYRSTSSLAVHLQCAIPVFENLLPDPHNRTILNLLFDLATWHAYAKLRLHTSNTLSFFDTATLTLANSVRQFVKVTCNAFDTRELPQETTTRGRRKPAFAGSSSGQASTSHSTTNGRC